MSEQVQERVAKCVAQVLALSPGEIRADARLMEDLGAESLDLVELMYVLEAEFGIVLEQDDLSLSAQLGLSDAEIHRGEVLTDRALELLRQRFPGSEQLLVPGVTGRQLGALLTVAEVARAVSTKLESSAAVGPPPPGT
jgi:acyl carrier protein